VQQLFGLAGMPRPYYAQGFVGQAMNAPLGFDSRLSLVANSAFIRVQLMRNVVIPTKKSALKNELQKKDHNCMSKTT